MKMYLIKNGILCKPYQDHVKQVSQELKEASLAPFRQQQLLVQHVYDPKADKDAIARAVASERGYWSSFQCEWATDIRFRPGSLVRLEPFLLRHGLLNFSSADVLQFM